MTTTTFRRLLLPDRHTTWWSVAGAAGAVSLAAMLWPRVLTTAHSDEANEALGMVRTDAGWLMPMDLGEHHREGDPRGGLQYMDRCPLFDEEGCWYGGSSLAAWAPLKEWERRGFDDGYLEAFLRDDYIAVFGTDA